MVGGCIHLQIVLQAPMKLVARIRCSYLEYYELCGFGPMGRVPVSNSVQTTLMQILHILEICAVHSIGHTSAGGVTLGGLGPSNLGSKFPLNGHYFWTQDWTQASRLVSQTRNIFLSEDP